MTTLRRPPPTRGRARPAAPEPPPTPPWPSGALSRPARRSCSWAGAGGPPAQGRTLAVEDPSTGEALCAVADASAADALDALATAHAAQAGWAAGRARDRARILRRAADELQRRSGPSRS